MPRGPAGLLRHVPGSVCGRRKTNVSHPGFDLLYRSGSGGAPKKTTLSERQFNRSKLKRSLLEELLEETREKDHEPDYDFNLIIPEPVAAVMEERYILEEEVGKVIDHGRKKGERFFNPENSNYLARLRLEHITDWVRYEEKGREVFVNSVYSHRMKAVEEETEELGGKGKGQEKKTDTAKQ
jgi:hypothetical protein